MLRIEGLEKSRKDTVADNVRRDDEIAELKATRKLCEKFQIIGALFDGQLEYVLEVRIIC